MITVYLNRYTWYCMSLSVSRYFTGASVLFQRDLTTKPTCLSRPEDDYSIEKMLALNYSYNVFVISDRRVPDSVHHTNNTYVITTAITANDPADFSRNSYGQRTVNDVMKSLHHARLDIVRLESLGSDSSMWEVLHHMILDNVLVQVKQLHITMRIGT